MNKYKNKIPKDDLKRFAKEIAKKLVASDFKAGRVANPNKIDERQQKKVKEFCKQFFEKAYQKHRKHEQEKSARRGTKSDKVKPDTGAETGSAAPSPGDSPGPTSLSPVRVDDEVENVKMSENEDDDPVVDNIATSPTSAQTPSEHNGTLKRKRVAPGTSNTYMAAEDDDRETTGSPAKRLNVSMELDTPPPPPPPPAPPIETPPASTPREGDDDGDVDMHTPQLSPIGQTDIHADTNFKGRSMADVLAQAQQESEDEDVVGIETDNPLISLQPISQ